MDRSHKHENGRGGLLKSTLIWQEIVHIWYTPKACKYCYTLKVAINEGVGQGRHPVPQDCRVAPLDQNPQSPPEVPNCPIANIILKHNILATAMEDSPGNIGSPHLCVLAQTQV